MRFITSELIASELIANDRAPIKYIYTVNCKPLKLFKVQNLIFNWPIDYI